MASTITTFAGQTTANSQAVTIAGNSGAFSFQCVASALDASDGTLTVEYSNDGTNFDTVPALTDILASGASDTHFNINAINHAFYRVAWAAGSNTAGTIVVTTNL